MTCLYIVRCDFVRPEIEASWNDWYSGEKVRQMLAKPMFRAVQRFRLAAGMGRSYLALWQLVSADALATPEYKADWGFSEWRPHIANWSRDLFDAGALNAGLAVPMRGALQVISFDGMDLQQANAAREALADEARAMWFRSVGLDRHTPLIGLTELADTAVAQPSSARPTPAGVQVGIYRPISAFFTAETVARDAGNGRHGFRSR
jgi:hypothetical protein